MAVKIHNEILDADRKKILPLLRTFKDNFYLAGGTGLALQLGHRVSVDFDFFTPNDFDTIRLFHDCEQIFSDARIEMTRQEKNTLSIIIKKKVKISFLTFPYPVILPLLETENIRLAQAQEIGVMKIAALLRATFRDYVDLYFLLQFFPLAELFSLARKKFKNFDEGIYLKCLLAYDDVEVSPVKYKKGFTATPSRVFSCIEEKTKEYLSAIKSG